MNIHSIFKSSEKLIVDNAPAILTGIGVIGTATTAYLAARGAYKSAEENAHEDFQRGFNNQANSDTVPTPPLTAKEKFVRNWVNYVPAVGTGALTITCVIFANKINAKRAAAIAAAYSLSEGRFKDYKAKIAEKLGIEEEKKVQNEIISDRIQQGPATTVILGDGEVLCFDAYSGRYFNSTQNKIDKAVNQINLLVLKENYQTLDDFWDLLGIEATAYGQENGFTADCPLEIEYGTMQNSEGKPCLVVKYDAEPIRRWNHFG